MTLPLFTTGPDRPRRLSLIRLSGELARAAAGLGRVAVEGEVHRPTVTGTGRIYFTLRDRAAQISVTCPPARAGHCRAMSGERVCAVGTMAWMNERGQLQLVADEVTPVGDGAVAAMLAEARRRLSADGLIDRPRRPIPALPGVIGVVCGVDAAVRRDIESVVATRYPGYPLRFAETFVSGPGAAVAISDALVGLAAQPDIDVVILARGGGDAAQLVVWSDEELCRTICACRVPVVSAIGHEGDRPLCDEVADLRCGTPSLAASAVVPDRAAIFDGLDRLISGAAGVLVTRTVHAEHRLARIDTGGTLVHRIRLASGRIGAAGDLVVMLHPSARCATARHRLSGVDLYQALDRRMAKEREGLAANRRHMEALSPRRVLERGYAVLRSPSGVVVRAASQVLAGDVLSAQLAKGALELRVESEVV